MDDKLKKLNKKLLQIKQILDSFIFIGQSYFNNDGAQLYLILQPLYYTLKGLGDAENAVSCKSKSVSTEKLTTVTTTDNSLCPSIKWRKNSSFYVIFKGGCSKQKSDFYSSKYNKFFYCL